MLYLGIDTSAYTTSAALVDEEKRTVWENRLLLEVKKGSRGLSQSEALFQHVQRLPEVVGNVPAICWPEVKAVAVSARPRSVEGSYMPVFTAGYGTAAAIAAALRVPLIATSHQEGHLAAGLQSCGALSETHFLAVHLSGGTTELLAVRQIKPGVFQSEILGATSDLHAGQLVDRVGVAMGLSFPAGRELERLAQKAAPGASSLLPSAVKGYEISFSGVESAAGRLLAEGVRPENVARAVEGCLVRTLSKVIDKGLQDTGLQKVLMVGGVASNEYIRKELRRKIRTDAALLWAQAKQSSDNAVGVAVIAATVARASC